MESKNYSKKRIDREIRARKEAERIMEEKSLELFYANEKLKKLNDELNESLSLNINALQESEIEKFALFENAAVGVIFTLQGKVIRTNHKIVEMTGKHERDIIGKSVLDLVYDDDVFNYESLLIQLHQKEIAQFNINLRLQKHNKALLWCNLYSSSVKTDDGVVKYTIHILEDIQEKKAIEAKQETLIAQLKEINNQLESFAHVVSHDLKAPLNGINTVMSWTRDHVKNLSIEDSELNQYFTLIEDRVRKMYKLIDGVMEYSKVSQGNEKREWVDVRQLAEETVQLISIPNHISIIFSGQFPTISVNKLKLKQVFLNLVDNASRHNDKKEGFIEINARENEHFWIFDVRDNGVGIEDKHINKIFKIFNTLDTSGKHTGIGLALVRKIVEHYKGRITVDSTLGQGTKFTFTLDKDTVKVAHE